MGINDLRPVGAGDDETVMPERNEALPLEQAQVGFQLSQPWFILMGVGTKEFNRCRCLDHGRTSSVSGVSDVDNSSIAQQCVLFLPFSLFPLFWLSGRDLWKSERRGRVGNEERSVDGITAKKGRLEEPTGRSHCSIMGMRKVNREGELVKCSVKNGDDVRYQRRNGG